MLKGARKISKQLKVCEWYLVSSTEEDLVSEGLFVDVDCIECGQTNDDGRQAGTDCIGAELN